MITNPLRRLLASGAVVVFTLAGGDPQRLAWAAGAEQPLPALDGAGDRYSDDKKHQIGRAWLRLFRANAKINPDPLLHDYMVHLLYGLAEHSQLRDRRLTLVMVRDSAFNAFAVPGGVVGVHDGLLRYSQAEDELASVLAHELGHLSQGHFERGQEKQQRNMRMALLGMLAGIALIGSDSDAGLAAIAASQAATVDSKLRYSRRFEQEADRIAIATLANAGWNPDAVPTMFERLQRTARFNRDIPAFLRTHPLTTDRISDARARAARLPRPQRTAGDNDYFLLMRERAVRAHQTDPQRAVGALRDALRQAKTRGARRAARYGLALALADAGQHRQAHRALAPLLAESPTHIPFVVARAEVAIAARDHGLAASLLAGHLALHPDNHPLTMTYADALVASGGRHIERAAKLLANHAKRHPEPPEVWQRLSHAAALAGNALDSHRARGEHYMRNGALDLAKQQFEYALKRTDSQPTTAKIKERLKVLQEYRKEQERLVAGKT